jgi:hypothetical protein
MEQLHINISHLEHKLTQLKDRYEEQKGIIEKLQHDNERLKRLSQQKQQNTFSYDAKKLQGGLSQFSQEEGSMRLAIEGYIQQIDQCIKYLEEQAE